MSLYEGNKSPGRPVRVGGKLKSASWLARAGLACWLAIGMCGQACADGGTVRVMEKQGPWQIAVFTSPALPRVGHIDVSVLVQRADSSAPVADAQVDVELVPRDVRGQQVFKRATRGDATNKLMQAAIVTVPQAGTWDVTVNCFAEGQQSQVCFALDVDEALPEWFAEWPWIIWPFGVVLVFGVHQALSRRMSARAARNIN